MVCEAASSDSPIPRTQYTTVIAQRTASEPGQSWRFRLSGVGMSPAISWVESGSMAEQQLEGFTRGVLTSGGLRLNYQRFRFISANRNQVRFEVIIE